MDEARRFVRYVLPGASAGVEFVLLMGLSYAPWPCLTSLSGSNSALPVSALLAFWALGYVFSVFHHVLLWSLYSRFGWTPDYRPLMIHAESKKWLELHVLGARNDVSAHSRDLTVPGAWRLVTALWHERVSTSDRIKSVDLRSDSLADITHGTGAAFVGSIAAVVAWIFVVYRSPVVYLSYSAITVAVIILLVHCVGLVTMSRHSESFVQMVLGDALRDEWEKARAPAQGILTVRDVRNQ